MPKAFCIKIMDKQKMLTTIVALVAFGLGFAARQFLPFNVKKRDEAVQLVNLISTSEGQVKDALFRAAALAASATPSAQEANTQAQQLVNSAQQVNTQRTAQYYNQLRQNLNQFYK